MIECLVFSDLTGGSGQAGSGEKLTQQVLADHAAACEEQLSGPVADAWDSAPVRCRVGAPNGADVGPNEWVMAYFQHSDEAGAAGYHAVDPKGKPYGRIFLDDAATMSKGASSASVIASHEAGEITKDPSANLFAMRADGTLDAFELCDKVQNTCYPAKNGIDVSNFLYPSAFVGGAPGPYDHLGVMKSQYDTSNGYGITATIEFDQTTNAAKLVTRASAVSAEQQARKQRPHSRASKRNVQW
jgi:hypothetical protein